MVWNDFFDLEQDRRERPGRPLPSGRIARKTAGYFGAGLLAAGLAFAVLAGFVGTSGDGTAWVGFRATAGILAGVLVLAILLYDAWLKRTWAGPIGMGLCRFLNVLLGFCATFSPNWLVAFHMAAVMGFYVAGITWFARTEARTSNRTMLILAGLLMLAGILLALPLPLHVAEGGSSVLFPYLLVGLGFLIGIPAAKAIVQPVPQRVQKAVMVALLGLVVLDAVMAITQAGIVGLLILLLLVPALFLGRWVYST